jgi:hypothetical protein
MLLLAALPVMTALADTAGANYPGTAATGGGSGSSWSASSGTLVAALGADGGATADVGGFGFSDSENLNMTNFGFAIPSGATINGITVEMNRYASGSGIADSTVSLLGGTLTGNNKAAAGNWSTTTSTVVTYGTITDTWGNTWTPAQINAAAFGVTLDITGPGGISTRTASVDYVRITVTYTTPKPKPPRPSPAPALSPMAPAVPAS